jgi:glutamate-1-semialdehyde 2,1-aminomutase
MLKIEGGWHGAHNDLLTGVFYPYDKPDSRGLPPDIDTDCIPFNDPQRGREAIRKKGGSLAAVIVEPVLGVGGFIPADIEFLKTLREETQKTGALLIYDEIISGFRVGMGGAQGFFGVLPDLTALGKILGGGMGIGAVAGGKDILELADPTINRSKEERTVIGGGTFSCHPLTMASGLAMLRVLEKQQESIYPELARKGDKLREGIEDAFASQGVLARCTGFGSLFMTHFPFEEDLVIKNDADETLPFVSWLEQSGLTEAFPLFLLGFAVDTKGDNGAGPQTFFIDLATAFLTGSIGPSLYLLQGPVDLLQQIPVPVIHTQQQAPVGLQRGLIGEIG